MNGSRKLFKRFIVFLVMNIIANAFGSTSRFESLVKKEVDEWPEGFTVMMNVAQSSISIVLQKICGRLCKRDISEKKCDLVITFKNVDAAFLLFTAQISTAAGYCEKRMCVSGDIPRAISVIRALTVIERYLFPAIIARRVMKRLPTIGFFRLSLGRIHLYTVGVLFGV
jgi:hypothetical protein